MAIVYLDLASSSLSTTPDTPLFSKLIRELAVLKIAVNS